MPNLNVVVFLKQVADNTKLKFSESGPVTDGVPMMTNPYDEYALETALRLKEAAGGESTVTAISLGTASAKEILKKAIAVGADHAFLLTDDAFKDGDSTANAVALSQAVKTLVPEYGVLIFGQTSLDELSAQTGPKVAEILNLPSLTLCKNAELKGDVIHATRESDRGQEVHEISLPGVLCTMKCDYELRSSNIKGVMKANKADIPVKTAADLGLDTSKVGLAGSPTRVLKTWQRPAKAGGKMIQGAEAQAAVTQLLDELRLAKVL